MYNKYISLEKAAEYRRKANEGIDEDKSIPYEKKVEIKKCAIIMEVCMAGVYLAEQLTQLGCPDCLIDKIIRSAGKTSFGKKDVWEIHQNYLKGYQDGKLDFEPEPGIVAN